MDEALLKQLIRQMKILNIWISVFGTLILVAFIICLYLVFKVVIFVQDTRDQLSSIKQDTENTLNVQKQLCDSATISEFLSGRSSFCR